MEQEPFVPDEGRGRSAKKRAAKQIEDHAQQLVVMSDAALRRLSLPQEIATDLETARSTGGHASRKRAIKHLAGLLRRDEEAAAAVAEFLAGEDAARYSEAARFHDLEQWRDRLLNPVESDAALTAIAEAFPGLPLKEIARLARAGRNGDKGAARKLFRLLRDGSETD